MSWKHRVTCRMHGLRARRADWRKQKADWRERKRAGEEDALVQSGPPNGFALLPWLLMGLGAFSHLLQGKTPNPWIGGIGLFVFNSLYIGVAFRAFDKRARESRATLVALLVMGALTVGLAAGYGGNWLMYFPLFGLAVGAVVRGRHLGPVALSLSALAGTVAGLREGWDGINIAYGTFLSTMVTAAILSLSEAVRDLLREPRRDLVELPGFFGQGSTPLVEGDKLIVNVGAPGGP